MMASCPGSCCQWMSPMCCHRARRVGEAVTTTPSTTWPWSRKINLPHSQ
uniref:Alternative protein LOXHD1 n=1 Tax=Homo sapiens TaxID=9606 RepID=L8E9L3_HUMAN|nr:alternative protein LOXHD1 [Homo sapiens]